MSIRKPKKFRRTVYCLPLQMQTDGHTLAAVASIGLELFVAYDVTVCISTLHDRALPHNLALAEVCTLQMLSLPLVLLLFWFFPRRQETTSEVRRL